MAINLCNHDIHLWFVDINHVKGTTILKQYESMLSASERERNQRFIFEKDRKRHMITRALLRSVLSEYYDGIAPQNWCFTENDYGKPQISPEMLITPLSFNLSHSGRMIVLAVTNKHAIGVDIETLKQKTPSTDLAKHYFAPEEYQQLKGLTNNEFHSHFFDFWTLKEAYIKACGLGLSIPLDSFSFSFVTPLKTSQQKSAIKIDFSTSRRDDPAHWQFWQILPMQDYKVALAINSTVKIKQAEQIVMREIIPLQSYSEVEYDWQK
ncbi:MAG: 4'-phosphopantetheinyl transferase [Oleiphilaceae bacterium]|jgi:4'-phosphopantetheinyl transferase